MCDRAVQTESSGPVVVASDFAELHTLQWQSQWKALQAAQASKAERKGGRRRTDLVGNAQGYCHAFPDVALYVVYCKGVVDRVTDWPRVYKLTCGPMDWL